MTTSNLIYKFKSDSKKYNVLLTVLCLITAFPLLLSAGNFGKIHYTENSIKISREGNMMIYRWKDFFNWEEIKFTLIVDFIHPYDYMQRIYSQKDHTVNGNLKRYLDSDPFNFNLINVACNLRLIARTYNINDYDLALSFVQAFPYQEMSHYQRYAVETLLDGMGDCSDTSVLLGGIFSAMKYGFIWLHYDEPPHAGVAILSVWSRNGVYFKYKNQPYYYCETACNVGDYMVGELPDMLKGKSASIESNY